MSLLNISLDTLQPDRFVAMTRRQGHDRVLATIHQAVDLGYDPGVPHSTFQHACASQQHSACQEHLSTHVEPFCFMHVLGATLQS
jgi:hypothetical protein